MTGSSDAFDLQVNGYAGVDFNADDLTASAFAHARRRLAADGTGAFLATVITAAPAVLLARVARLAALVEDSTADGAACFGLHVEGPFLSADPDYAGAHPAEHTRDADPGFVRELLAAGAGKIHLVTLAPERDPHGLAIDMLRAADVRVAAGHTAADLGALMRAIDAGVTLFTHVGNGCPRQLDRHDNIVQRMLCLADRAWCCFIADGAHIPWFALDNYLRCATVARSIVVTDAIAAAGQGPGRHPFAGQLVDVGEDLVPRAPGNTHLIGSATTMARSRACLRAELGLSTDDIDALCTHNPWRALGLAAPAR